MFQEFGGSSSEKLQVITKLIHFLYNEDIVLETAIIAWYKQAPSHDEFDEEEEDMVDGVSKHEEVRKQVAD